MYHNQSTLTGSTAGSGVGYHGGITLGNPGQPDPPQSIAQSLDELTKTLMGAHEAVVSLESHLSPILAQQTGPQNGNVAIEPKTIQFVDRIATAVVSLRSLTQRVNDIGSRAQI